MPRTTRAPVIFGAILMLVGGVLYLLDMEETGRNLHMFVVPSVVLLAMGALFAFVGSATRDRPRDSSSQR
jgi:hypothetical protein